MIKKVFRKYFELVFWVAALIALGFSDPSAQGHYVICPFRLMGFNRCPGCGIGHSITWLLHGNIGNSWHAHWLGVPALIMIAYRIVSLSMSNVLGYGNMEQRLADAQSKR